MTVQPLLAFGVNEMMRDPRLRPARVEEPAAEVQLVDLLVARLVSSADDEVRVPQATWREAALDIAHRAVQRFDFHPGRVARNRLQHAPGLAAIAGLGIAEVRLAAGGRDAFEERAGRGDNRIDAGAEPVQAVQSSQERRGLLARRVRPGKGKLNLTGQLGQVMQESANIAYSYVRSFADDYGVRMTDGPLEGLLARAVVVVDTDGRVLHTQLVPAIGQEPDYDAAVEVLGGTASGEDAASA